MINKKESKNEEALPYKSTYLLFNIYYLLGYLITRISNTLAYEMEIG